MKIWQSAVIAVPLTLTGLTHAEAACYFSPYSFFPDRNDQVQIQVTTDSGESCAMAFKEGPGFKFTSASFLKPPPHGVLAKTGATNSCICRSRATRAMIATRSRSALSCRDAAAARP